MNWIGILMLLVPNAYSDLKRRQILFSWTVLMGIGAVIWHIWLGDSVTAMALGLLPGCVLCGTAILRPDSLGIGDGLVVGAAGLWTGAAGIMGDVFLSCLLMLLWIVPGVLHKKVNRKTALPFVPFLLAAVGVNLVWECIAGHTP